jgi:methylthioribose-1-phosphate isomerase
MAMKRELIDTIRPIAWREDRLWLLDQRALPSSETYLDYSDCAAVAAAITDMVVRGAPPVELAQRLRSRPGPARRGQADRGQPALGRDAHATGGDR